MSGGDSKIVVTDSFPDAEDYPTSGTSVLVPEQVETFGPQIEPRVICRPRVIHVQYISLVYLLPFIESRNIGPSGIQSESANTLDSGAPAVSGEHSLLGTLLLLTLVISFVRLIFCFVL